jgi:hypothetical protein
MLAHHEFFCCFASDARVEPDMQKHTMVCRDSKVYNLTQIFSMVESHFPEPPAPALFLPINKKLLENEGHPNKDDPEKTNWIAVANLQALNHALEHGLWDGRVKVFQFGSFSLEGTKFGDKALIAGSMVDYFIALHAKIFVGTQVSSFSVALTTARLYRGQMENYEYLPDGLHHWTPPGTTRGPPFFC